MVFNGSKSEWARVLSGVPQGSVLGPLLFILYVNDIPDLVHCNIKMFADDTKLFTPVRSQEDQEHLQCDIATLEDWTKDWLLEFNADKCKLMQVGRPPPRNYTMTKMSGARVDHESINEEKDVGVWVTTGLKSSTQCQIASNKVMQALGMVRRSFKHITTESFVTLYRAYVRPHLEFCVQAWSPYMVKDIDSLEKVQCRAAKLVTSLAKLTYEQRLKHLRLHSIYSWRQRGDLIETFKILNGLENVEASKFFEMRQPGCTRGHTMKIVKLRARLLTSLRFFLIRVIDLWNGLPQNVVDVKTVP